MRYRYKKNFNNNDFEDDDYNLPHEVTNHLKKVARKIKRRKKRLKKFNEEDNS